jgi:hypothetical protein
MANSFVIERIWIIEKVEAIQNRTMHDACSTLDAVKRKSAFYGRAKSSVLEAV